MPRLDDATTAPREATATAAAAEELVKGEVRVRANPNPKPNPKPKPTPNPNPNPNPKQELVKGEAGEEGDVFFEAPEELPEAGGAQSEAKSSP